MEIISFCWEFRHGLHIFGIFAKNFWCFAGVRSNTYLTYLPTCTSFSALRGGFIGFVFFAIGLLRFSVLFFEATIGLIGLLYFTLFFALLSEEEFNDSFDLKCRCPSIGIRYTTQVHWYFRHRRRGDVCD